MPGQRNNLLKLQRHDLPKGIFEYIRIVILNIRIPFSVLVPIPTFNPLPDMPILRFSNSAEKKKKKDMMSKIWTKGDTII